MKRHHSYGEIEPKSFSGQFSQQLATKVMQIQSKRYFIDVKQNNKTKYFKLSEVEENGRKNKITLDLKSVADFHDQLTEFSEFYSSLGPRSFSGDRRHFASPLKSEVINCGDRRLYLDLKENNRGRFLKVSLTFGPPSSERHHIIVPAQGMIDMRDALTELLSEFGAKESKDGRKCNEEQLISGNGEGLYKDVAKEEDSAVKMTCDEQTFKFDVSENCKGVFLKVFEVNRNFEKSISVPKLFWDQFLDHLKHVTST